MSSASKSCCCRNSTIISGDGGADFSATRGDGSRREKFTARIKIQTAARPAHAFGCGQNRLASCWLKVARNEACGVGRAADRAAARISARHSCGTGRSGWRCKRSSNWSVSSFIVRPSSFLRRVDATARAICLVRSDTGWRRYSAECPTRRRFPRTSARPTVSGG